MRTSSVVLLPHAASSVSAARRRLSADLTASGVPETAVDDANVIVSELLSNALRHARPLPSGQVRLSWAHRGDLLELAVSDGGASTEPRRGPGTLSSLGGRGLGIVETLSRDWGVRHEDGATTVWATLDAPRHGDARRTVPPVAAHAAIPEFAELADVPDEPDDLATRPRHETTSRAYPG
ncbi:ATP-binding protein [Actinomadura parmotrematis]|uniref:ATP-binding protein n=1 Tax=Actinomadura parmotrematis TaxID=2864039 RepID=UPI0027E2DEF8|nr:ATP-binding protein [Actinomadura parmotrematis]